MSLAEKTRATLEAGKANRGEFKPKADSLPVRSYNYWLNNSKSDKAEDIRYGSRRENFCHYWRVVAIWAPLLKLGKSLNTLVENPITYVVLGIIAIALLVGGSLFIDGFFVSLAIGVGILLAIVAAGLALVVGLSFLGDFIEDRFPKFVVKVENFFKSWKTWAGIGGLILAAIVYATSAGTGGIGYIVWASVFAFLGLSGFAIVKALDYAEGKRAQRQAEWDALDFDTQDAIFDYLHDLNRIKRKPNRVERWFVGAGNAIVDVLEFIVQVVRVNKWKICPLVEIPQETREDHGVPA